MKVLKFGGTSVGSAQGIAHVKQIVADACGECRQVIVVVSALGGVTDQLLNISRTAAQGDRGYEREYLAMARRHEQLIAEVVAPGRERDTLLGQVRTLLAELGNIFQGICLIRDLSPKTSDTIVSYGERLSSLIIATVTGAEWKDARLFIKTERKRDKNILNAELTNRLIREHLSQLPALTLIPGFIASDERTGETTNLGRGGSDYTAAIVAAELEAGSLEIWTDVDGFMTADPKVISSAYTIGELSYVEATELCNFGAKVVYPPTIYPVYHKQIPILIKNTFNPQGAGTIIKQTVEGMKGRLIKGISSINDTCLITVRGLGMVGVVGVNRRIFHTLASHGISVFLVAQASSENSTSIGVRDADVQTACRVLDQEFAKEIETGEIFPMNAEHGLATVAIVGENMKDTPGIAGKLFSALGRSGISVIACAQGAFETNISFVIKKQLLRKALNVIHDSFFLSEYKVLNLFICGIGTVGDSLIKQICSQRQKLMRENGLQLNVVGIANSRRGVFTRDGIPLENYRQELQERGTDSSIEALRREVIGMNIFNAVFVDCTANADVAKLYKDFFTHNISVVAANKISASSAYGDYVELKQIAHQRGVKYLFETNVGAGLPIIRTINDLIHSGDKILRIEAVLSGTLNFVFDNLSAQNPLSQVIRQAKEAGIAEPDPRIDLSGTDVTRKLVILAREAGYRIEQSEVEKNLFIPDSLLAGSLEEFWEKLPTLDKAFEEQRVQLERSGKRWKFVARFAGGKGSVGIEVVDASHPFYGLGSSNNIIMLTTERYNEYPLIIQGYGAGAAVTSAGVFADIMRIANV